MTQQKPGGFIRMTNQRRVIIDVLKSTDCHPTAEWVFEQVREKLPSVSLGTVYSNLRRLVDQGEVRELYCDATQCRYDGNTSNHAHFVCRECGAVLDLPLQEHEKLIAEVESLGFQVYSQCLQFYGICHSCQSKESSLASAEA